MLNLDELLKNASNEEDGSDNTTKTEPIKKNKTKVQKSNHELLKAICDTYEYFKDESGKPYAEVIDPHGKSSTVEIQSEDFHNNLKNDFVKKYERFPQITEIKNVADLFHYSVKTSDNIEALCLRFGDKNGENYIDLNNSKNESNNFTDSGDRKKWRYWE